jgi:hypothetical protein
VAVQRSTRRGLRPIRQAQSRLGWWSALKTVPLGILRTGADLQTPPEKERTRVVHVRLSRQVRPATVRYPPSGIRCSFFSFIWPLQAK